MALTKEGLSSPVLGRPSLEERYISIGLSTPNRLLLVAHMENRITEKETIVRIISCRKVTLLERRTYEED